MRVLRRFVSMGQPTGDDGGSDAAKYRTRGYEPQLSFARVEKIN
jgi:hypothetical protein